MSDDSTNSSGDDSQETAHRQPKDQYGMEDLPIAPGPAENPGTPIPVPGGPDPIDPDAPKPPPETLDEAGFSIVPGQTRVVGPPRAKHQPKSKSASRSHHSGAHIFGGKEGAGRFAEHLQESVVDSQADAAEWDETTAGSGSGSGPGSGDVSVVMGQAEPPDPPPVADIPPAWSLPPFAPPPKPPHAHKPPPAPKPPQGSIEGGHRPRPAPLAVPQPPPQPEDVGDFAEDAGQVDGDQIGADAAEAASVGGDAIGSDASSAAQPPQQADGIGVGSSGGRTSTAFASGPLANSSANDSMRDVRDLITAFREAIEKLSEAADKLSQAAGHGGNVDRLDV